jgi:RNA polymerase sigma-70 factor (ECF subfamily)
MTEASQRGRPDAAAEEDLRLIERVLAGDRQAFEALVRNHERRVFRVTLAVLGQVEDAEDAMQDTFIKVYRHLNQFRRESRFTTWLTRIAVNEALQRRQARKDHFSLDESPDAQNQQFPHYFEPWAVDPEKLYTKQELRELVEKAIRSLPAIYREALILCDIEGVAGKEAADVLGVNLAAFKSRLLRSRLMMREALSASLAQRRPLSRRVADTAAEVKNMMGMMLMRAVGK